jgi:hypothetical protein
MADLVFRQGIDPSSPFNGIGFTKIKDNVVRAGSNIGNVVFRDVVKISYNDTFQKAIYGVCTNEATGEITFDENIYPVALSTFTGTVYRYNDTDVEEVSVYRIGVDVENGLYSKAYAKYSSEVTYSLIIPARRAEYFGVSDKLLNNSDVAFLDLCDNVAYGVGFSDGSFDNLNNKFKSSLEFNIATR